MDWESHYILGKIVLNRCKKDPSYAEWSVSPDLDLGQFLHRFHRHRISTLPQIFQEYSIKHPSALVEDRLAISICILSHLYLDIFNGWVFCWGLKPPAIHMPTAVIKEYVRDLNANLFDQDPEGAKAFYHESEIIFNELPRFSSEDAINATLTELLRFTPCCCNPATSINHISDFTGVQLEFQNSLLFSSITSRYFNFLDNFLQAMSLESK